MRVLFLGPDGATLDYLRRRGETVTHYEDPISTAHTHLIDAIVSHGYRHILSAKVIASVPLAVNLHISILPWNRGADPNFWSHVDGTPKGVTIHYLDEGLDTGPIIAQREVATEPGDTLATSYARLQDAMTDLFVDVWPGISRRGWRGQPQQGSGSYHRSADKAPLEHLLTDGWDTPVAALAR